MIRVYTQIDRGYQWLHSYRGKSPLFACVFGFTETGTLPGISAAGRTPEDRRKTALADAEYLLDGPKPLPRYPLPPLAAGASPAVISRAVVTGLAMPTYLFDAGLPEPIPKLTQKSSRFETIDLEGTPAQCLMTGSAMEYETTERLLELGLLWGDRLARSGDYAILGECVVGGTTTALAVLLGLGFEADGYVNSSYPECNHERKRTVVRRGLQRWRERCDADGKIGSSALAVVAALGDPMQVVVAGMTISLSRHGGVLLAGGTQMLAVYALARAIARERQLTWYPEQVVVGTTRWVVEDPTGHTVQLARLVGNVPLVATQLNLSASRYPQLQAYERGYVKEGVGAGGCAIAASLHDWSEARLLDVVDATFDRLDRSRSIEKVVYSEE
ncbi:MAG: TIGR00303 family protein [Cyanobacteria bacterium SID2]|nr:TIGR00303 family protein [Cyanobacteria bacterium SID2]MBP0006542.1 TIGR00303 family protein [Cyanobacteria bacterium SBC]